MSWINSLYFYSFTATYCFFNYFYWKFLFDIFIKSCVHCVVKHPANWNFFAVFSFFMRIQKWLGGRHAVSEAAVKAKRATREPEQSNGEWIGPPVNSAVIAAIFAGLIKGIAEGTYGISFQPTILKWSQVFRATTGCSVFWIVT